MTAIGVPLRRAFSMIELLVVILIIVIVVAIVVPALGSARDAAKKSATQNLMQEMQGAITQFTLSERRLPGQFTASEMGQTANATRGMSAMQNAMLELAGGGIVTGTPPADAIEVGPGATAASRVQVSPDLIGSQKGAYFTPAAKFFKRQNGVEGEILGGNGNVHKDLPEVVDADGTPILLWTADSAAVGPVSTFTDMARIASGNGNTATPSRFYWNSNAAYLAGQRVGKGFINQDQNSVIGGSAADAVRERSLAGFLGNPSSPDNVKGNVDEILPTAPRGSFVIHAAGRNRIYLGKTERGGKLAQQAGGNLHYGFNFKDVNNNALAELVGTENRNKSADVAASFDDLLVSGSTN